jgi:hypothetical protein
VARDKGGITASASRPGASAGQQQARQRLRCAHSTSAQGRAEGRSRVVSLVSHHAPRL